MLQVVIGVGLAFITDANWLSAGGNQSILVNNW